jgi:hypothetical protein
MKQLITMQGKVLEVSEQELSSPVLLLMRILYPLCLWLSHYGVMWSVRCFKLLLPFRSDEAEFKYGQQEHGLVVLDESHALVAWRQSFGMGFGCPVPAIPNS